MTLREYYVQRREAELPVFMEVFKALPEGELDYKPADESPTAKQIAWIMTRQLKSSSRSLRTEKLNGKNPTRPRRTSCWKSSRPGRTS